MNPPQAPLRAFSAALFGAACAVALWLGTTRPVPAVEALALFAALTLYSESKVIPVGRGAISAGWMIWIAAIVAFDGALFGALIIGMIAVIEPHLVRSRSWQVLSLGAGATGFALLAAAGAHSMLPARFTDTLPLALVAPGIAALAYIAVLWPIAMVTYRLKFGYSVRDTLNELVPSTAQFIPFSLLGFFIGRLYLELGAGVMLLIIVPILIAREMFASYLKVRQAHDETVHMLVRALETKDKYTAGHSERVATYAEYLGEEFAFGPARLERLRFAALMHDIGKLVVPNHILNKPGRLTEAEFARVRLHESVSVQMLSNIDFLRPIAAVAQSEAMRFNPDDPDHPVEPYIVMIADAFDAMTSTRAYRQALPQDVAFRELRAKAGTQFHPQCVEAFIHALEKRDERHGAGHEIHIEFEHAPVGGLGSAGLGDLHPSEA